MCPTDVQVLFPSSLCPLMYSLILSTVLDSSGGTHAAAHSEVRDSAVLEVSTVEAVLGQTSDGLAVFELACRTYGIDAGE